MVIPESCGRSLVANFAPGTLQLSSVETLRQAASGERVDTFFFFFNRGDWFNQGISCVIFVFILYLFDVFVLIACIFLNGVCFF